MSLICSTHLTKNYSALSNVKYILQGTKKSSLISGRNNSSFAISKINRFCNDVRNHFIRLGSTYKQTPVPIASINAAKKRVPRKKAVIKEENLLENRSVFAFATADEYDMQNLRLGLLKNSRYIPTIIDDFQRSNVLYTELDTVASEREQKHIYFFQEGGIVMWNITESECRDIIELVKKYESTSYNESIVDSEQEMMPFAYCSNGQRSDLIEGQIVIATDKGNVAAALDRYTFSNAMIVSVKLGVWESVLEHYITSIELLTNDLKTGNKIRISRDEVLKKTGELFALRHAINLSSDVLDVPDFYWDRDELEKLYIKMCQYFSISRRTKVINEKLSHCLELLELISSNLNDKHHVRLEWMIIILITLEACIGVAHLVVAS